MNNKCNAKFRQLYCYTKITDSIMVEKVKTKAKCRSGNMVENNMINNIINEEKKSKVKSKVKIERVEKVCVAGMGLIGSSMAKAVQEKTQCQVFGWNRTASVVDRAIADGVVEAYATDEILGEVDLLIVALMPQVSIDYILNAIPKLKKGAIVVDCVGVKSAVIAAIQDVAKAAGVIFVGGHPMAGLEVNGYENSSASLYENASMILVPNLASTEAAIEDMSIFFRAVGFGKVVVCSAQKHDEMIAFTSQLAHVVSNAYVKSPRCEDRNGFSAGSYKDMTRVAKLDENMWQELFLLNKEALVCEIEELMRHLTEIREVIVAEDKPQLTELLRIGRERKERLG